jgi:hypothetical protein
LARPPSEPPRFHRGLHKGWRNLRCTFCLSQCTSAFALARISASVRAGIEASADRAFSATATAAAYVSESWRLKAPSWRACASSTWRARDRIFAIPFSPNVCARRVVRLALKSRWLIRMSKGGAAGLVSSDPLRREEAPCRRYMRDPTDRAVADSHCQAHFFQDVSFVGQAIDQKRLVTRPSRITHVNGVCRPIARIDCANSATTVGLYGRIV